MQDDRAGQLFQWRLAFLQGDQHLDAPLRLFPGCQLSLLLSPGCRPQRQAVPRPEHRPGGFDADHHLDAGFAGLYSARRFLSDRFKTRKLFIIIANVIIAAGMVAFGTVSSWTHHPVTMGVLGVGFGISVSVDAALVTPVLPSANNRAKAMGIIPLANTLPQSLTSATVALIISTSHLAYSFQVWIR